MSIMQGAVKSVTHLPLAELSLLVFVDSFCASFSNFSIFNGMYSADFSGSTTSRFGEFSPLLPCTSTQESEAEKEETY